MIPISYHLYEFSSFNLARACRTHDQTFGTRRFFFYNLNTTVSKCMQNQLACRNAFRTLWHKQNQNFEVRITPKSM